MTEIVFATANPNKVREIKEMLPDNYSIKSLADIGCHEDIPETSPTIEGNAILKAKYVKEHFGLDCFAEDTGLEVEALDGAPGVYSARYAGPQKNAEENMRLLLERLAPHPNRKARFKTVIALIMGEETFTFEGIINGHIAQKRSGEGGFGYDPIFIPEKHQTSFAEMDKNEKNAISHRGRALVKLINFLEHPKNQSH